MDDILRRLFDQARKDTKKAEERERSKSALTTVMMRVTRNKAKAT